MRSELGMAMLEMAVMFVVTFLFLMLGISASEFVSLASNVERMVDKVVYDDGFIPYRTVNTSAGPQLELRRTELQNHIRNNIIAKLENELQKLNVGNAFEVEADYIEIDVDSEHGSAQLGVNTEHFSSQQYDLANDVIGSAHNPINDQVEMIVGSTRRDIDGREIFSYASPTAGYSLDGARFKFFPRKLLIGVWVAVDVRESFWLTLGKTVFQESLVQRSKTIVLRGEATI